MGQNFDRLCAILERHWKNPRLRECAKRAHLFDFPGRLHEVAASLTAPGKRLVDYSLVGGVEFVFENFFLPFPVVAVEDTASCVLVIDNEEGQRGLAGSRTFVECYSANMDLGEWAPDPRLPSRLPPVDHMPPDAQVLTVSRINMGRLVEGAPGNVPVEFQGDLGLAMIVSRKRGVILHPQEFLVAAQGHGGWLPMAESVVRNDIAALEEIMYFNTPDRFVVRQSPERPRRKGAKGPDLLRSNERDRYILLRPQEIRERFGLSEEPVNERKSPHPHARRRHYRTLRSDRFKESKGKTIVVPASWIGPTEGAYKGRRYEVCLEL